MYKIISISLILSFKKKLLNISNWEKYLERIYFDPSHPSSYEGPKQLYDSVKKEGKYRLSHSQIKRWLQKQNSYSINKTAKRNFQRS